MKVDGLVFNLCSLLDNLRLDFRVRLGHPSSDGLRNISLKLITGVLPKFSMMWLSMKNIRFSWPHLFSSRKLGSNPSYGQEQNVHCFCFRNFNTHSGLSCKLVPQHGNTTIPGPASIVFLSHRNRVSVSMEHLQ